MQVRSRLLSYLIIILQAHFSQIDISNMWVKTKILLRSENVLIKSHFFYSLKK